MFNEIPQLEKQGLRKFGLVTGAIFGTIFGILLPWIKDHGFVLWPWIVVSVLWTLALIAPLALNPVYNGWMRVGNIVGRINTSLILLIIFYVIIFPVGIFMRIFGRDPLSRKLDKNILSYRVSSHRHSKYRMEKPF